MLRFLKLSMYRTKVSAINLLSGSHHAAAWHSVVESLIKEAFPHILRTENPLVCGNRLRRGRFASMDNNKNIIEKH